MCCAKRGACACLRWLPFHGGGNRAAHALAPCAAVPLVLLAWLRPSARSGRGCWCKTMQEAVDGDTK